MEMVVSNLRKNVERAKGILKKLVPKIPRQRTCVCQRAMANAIITSPDKIPAKVKKELAPLIGRYVK